jgi:hypothetical protein
MKCKEVIYKQDAMSKFKAQEWVEWVLYVSRSVYLLSINRTAASCMDLQLCLYHYPCGCLYKFKTFPGLQYPTAKVCCGTCSSPQSLKAAPKTATNAGVPLVDTAAPTSTAIRSYHPRPLHPD